MGLFRSKTEKFIDKLAEETLYEKAVEEVASGQMRMGLYGKALVEVGGDEVKAKVRYLKLRVDTMIAELQAAHEIEQAEAPKRKAEEEQRRKDEEERQQELIRQEKAKEEQRRKAELLRLRKEQASQLILAIKQNPGCPISEKIRLIELLGGRFCWETRGFFSTPCRVVLPDFSQIFPNEKAFNDWVVNELVNALHQH